MATLSCLLYAADDAEREKLARSLSSAGAEVLASWAEPAEILGASRDAADVIFGVLDDGTVALLDALSRLGAARPQLVLLGLASHGSLLPKIMAARAQEYLPRDPDDAAVATALGRLDARAEVQVDAPVTTPIGVRSASVQGGPPVVAVLGAKGGAGATVVACQLAGAFQAGGASTCLLDLDVHSGDAALQLDLDPARTLADAARTSQPLDAMAVDRIAEKHESGISVVAAPDSAADAAAVEPRHVERALELLRARHEWVVADLPSALDPVCHPALAAAEVVLLVFTLDLPGVASARRSLERLAALGISGERVRLVANRWSRRDRVSLREAERFLKRAPDARIPNDYTAISRSVGNGRPVCLSAVRGDVRDAYLKLARRIHVWMGIDIPRAIAPKRARSGSRSAKRSRAARFLRFFHVPRPRLSHH